MRQRETNEDGDSEEEDRRYSDPDAGVTRHQVIKLIQQLERLTI